MGPPQPARYHKTGFGVYIFIFSEILKLNLAYRSKKIYLKKLKFGFSSFNFNGDPSKKKTRFPIFCAKFVQLEFYCVLSG